MSFVKAHGLEIAGGGHIKNLVVETFTTALEPTPNEQGRTWYNSDTDRWMMSVDNGSGSIIKKTFANKEELDAFQALLVSTVAGEGANNVGYEGSGSQTNGLFEVTSGLLDDALDTISTRIDTEMKEIDDIHLNYVLRNGTQAMTAALDAGGFKVTNMANGIDALDAINKQQLDSVQTGMDTKLSCRAATDVNLSATYDNGAGTLTSLASIHLVADDVRMDVGNRVLVKEQTNGYENGIYEVTQAGSVGDAAEVTDITAQADVSGSMSGRYFLLNDPTTEYYVWIDVGNTSTNPNAAGKPLEGTTKTGIEVDISADATAIDVANAIQAKLDLETDFGATDDDAGKVTVTNANNGDVSNAQDAESSAYAPGFTYNVTTQGDAAANPYILTRSYDADNSPSVGEVTSGKILLAAYMSNHIIKNSVNSVDLLY